MLQGLVPNDHSQDITLLILGYRFRTIKSTLTILNMLKSVLSVWPWDLWNKPIVFAIVS